MKLWRRSGSRVVDEQARAGDDLVGQDEAQDDERIQSLLALSGEHGDLLGAFFLNE
jgi:hypothetical protein